MTRTDREQDIWMMKMPQLWPMPYLPIKRYVDGTTGEEVTSARLGKGPQCGFLMWGSDFKTVPLVYLTNSVQAAIDKIPLSQIPTKQYESFEAIVDDGWVVD